MGHQVDKTDTGQTIEIHRFDSKQAAESYVTRGRRYTFDRHEPWGFTSGFDFYRGEPKQWAAIRSRDTYWSAVFWEGDR